MKMAWDKTGEKFYETGTKNFALYLQASNGTYPTGVPWNGITSFTESPDGAEANDLWADDQKYLSIRSTETYGFSIGAYTYPDEFELCDGTATPVAGVKLGQQSRRAFGLVGKTTVGNDIDFNDHAYKLHLIYGATASPSERDYATINDSPEAIEFSWDCETTPIPVEGFKPVSCITIDSRTADASKLKDLEDILFGVTGTISYSEVSSTTGKNPVEEGWYERSGSEGSYVYTLSTDTEADSEKTYYTATETGGTNPSLPLPERVLEIMGYVAPAS